MDGLGKFQNEEGQRVWRAEGRRGGQKGVCVGEVDGADFGSQEREVFGGVA